MDLRVPSLHFWVQNLALTAISVYASNSSSEYKRFTHKVVNQPP